MSEGGTSKLLCFAAHARDPDCQLYFCEACPSTYLHSYLQESFHISHIQNTITGPGLLDSLQLTPVGLPWTVGVVSLAETKLSPVCLNATNQGRTGPCFHGV